jgi:hypothetical protein
VLEERRLLATFTVTSTLDTVDNSNNPTTGTLRWAVEQANLASSPSVIAFSLGSGPQTITLAQLLKPVELSNTAEPITIDGTGANLLTINAHDEGAALRIDPGVNATITGLTVTNASLDLNHNGGAISNLGTLTISDCTLAGNTISGIYDDANATAIITDCTITGNNSYSGAGVFVKGTATVTNCTINDNKGAQGAGICNQGTTTVTNCTISGDSALGGGGGLYNSGKLSVYGSTISGVTGGGGGGLYNKKGTAYLSGCTISDGSGFINGGGLDNQYGATLDLANCTVEANSANTGGGLYNAGTATFTDCTLSSNTATGSGGGVASGPLQNKAVLTITGSTLSGNTAKLSGGGVFNNGTATLIDCTLAGNFANQAGSLLASNGGGLDNSGTATLVACTISGNTTTAKGGGIYDGGIGADKVTLTDSIVAGNTAVSSGGSAASDIVAGNNDSVSGSYNLVGTGGSATLGAGNHNLLGVSDPGLGPLASNGGPTQTLALLANSPAIGAGVAVSGVTADQRGDPLDSPDPDIGAFQIRLNRLTFSGLTSPSITYGASSATLAGTLAGGPQTPGGESVAVTLNGDTQQATIGANGAFSTTFDTSNLSVAGSPYSVTYTYRGDGTYASASATSTVTVTQTAAAVALGSSGGSAVFGQAVTFVATVTAGAAVPTGSVTFYDGARPLGTVPLDGAGRATLTTSALAVGAHAITAAYGGDTDDLGATSGAASETVAKAGAQVVLVPRPAFKKKKLVSLGLEAEVRATAPGAGVPSGMVTFEVQTKAKKKVGEKVLGTAALSGGAATLSVQPNAVLKKPLTIIYAGDADFTSVTASPPTLTQATLKSLARPLVALQARGRVRGEVLIATGRGRRA